MKGKRISPFIWFPYENILIIKNTDYNHNRKRIVIKHNPVERRNHNTIMKNTVVLYNVKFT